MTVTFDSPYLRVCRISRDRFRQLAFERFAPAVLEERDPGESWDCIWSYQVDPLFVLRIFKHESTYGRYGVAVTTHSWGNTRAPSFGATPIGETPGRTGTFPIFANWLDGAASTAARLAAPDWVYAGEGRSIGQVFIDPQQRTPPVVWAPAGDLNDPESYLKDVLDGMNADADLDEEAPVTQPAAYPFIPSIDMINWKGSNRPGRKLRSGKPRFHTIHETANTNPGAGAVMHANFVRGGGGSEGVSFHDSVDADVLVDIIPGDEVAWHAGDGANGVGNNESRATETCVNKVNNPARWAQVKENLARNIARRCVEDGRSIATVVQHNHWSGKDCPHYLRSWGEWTGVLSRARQLLEGQAQAEEFPRELLFPQTDHTMRDGFLRYWYERGALPIFGFPIEDEQARDGRTWQYSERHRFEWHPGQFPDDWDVQLGLLGTELRDLNGWAERSEFTCAPQDPHGDPAARYFSETGHNLTNGFRLYWETYGGLPLFGYPISEEFVVDTPEGPLTVQWFERARMEWRKDQYPDRFDVTLGQLGRERLALG